MILLDRTFADPRRNLACDELLLEQCERGDSGAVLRFWAPHVRSVVLGYANHAAREADLRACSARQIPVLRRISGGGTVVQGPGCLNYALVMPILASGPLASLTGTTAFVMERHRAALAVLTQRVIRIQGVSDLTVDGRKFSGNAQRRLGRAVLFHGVFLLHADLALIEELLPLPSRSPAYRHARSHLDFLTNLGVPARRVKAALCAAWDARPGGPLPLARRRLDELVTMRYATEAWTMRC